MSELVVDANVFAHALNPAVDYYDSALEVLRTLVVDSELLLALDDTGKASPSLATSNLYKEYLNCIPTPSFSADVLTLLLASQRVVFHLRPKPQKWKICKSLVPRNNHDAIVLGIGVETDQREIVSNDYADFDKSVRRQASKVLGVNILDSDEYRAS